MTFSTIHSKLALIATTATVFAVGTPRAEARHTSHSQTHYQRYEVHYYTYNPAHYRYRVLPPRWSVGMHLTGLSANHRVRDEGLAMGGVGTHLRMRGFWVGAELAIDVLGNQFAEGGITRTSVPIQASGMFYLIPHGRLNVYLLAGARFVPTKVRWDLPGLEASQTFTEVGGQAGVGAELVINRRFSLTGDLRAFGTVRNNNDIAGKYYKDLGTEANTPVPQKTAGLQASFGASFRF